MPKEITVIDVLRRMRVILRKGWAQGYYARGKSGRQVNYHSKAATSFCLYGAAFRSCYELEAEWDVECKAKRLVEKCVPDRQDIPMFNDAPERKKSEVLAVVTCAIKKATNTSASDGTT